MNTRQLIKHIILTGFLVVAAGLPLRAVMLDDPGYSLHYVPDQAATGLHAFVTQNEPPAVTSVSLSPDPPVAGEPVTVTAIIVNNPSLTSSRPLEAFVHYSADGGDSWETIEMDATDSSRQTWSAEIAAQPQSTMIQYFFTAGDDAGNVLLELPVQDVYQPWQDYMLQGVTDDDDSRRIVQDDLDVLGAGAAFDGTYLYLSMDVQGDIEPGTVSPLSAHLYSVGIYYPDELNNGMVRPDLLLEYAPHASLFTLPDLALLDMKRSMGEVLRADPQMRPYQGRLVFRISAEALKDGTFESLRVIYGTARVTQLEYSMSSRTTSMGNILLDFGQPIIGFQPVDATAFVNLVRSDRSFTVGEPTVVGLAR